ncbi:MAG: ATP-grasp domain-containing protein [Spirochaetaceae bacterium]|nr:MAG: ATP-grasp domain-containing protein [Spirochaetaceae bacterium]
MSSTPARRILICGGGVMQVPAIRIATEEGWTVVVADGNPACPGRLHAHVFEHIDLKDERSLIDCARRNQVQAVFTAGTDFSLTVARIAEACGLPGIPVDAALHATDKALMRRRLRDRGVSVPPFAVYRHGERIDGATDVPLPAVVKPVANMGARGVRRITASEEIAAALAHAEAYSRDGRVIVESFIPGREYSIDCLVTPTEKIACGIADRHIAIPPYFVEIGHTIPSALPAELQALLTDEFFRAVDAIGIDCGAAKGDIFLVPDDMRPDWLPGSGPSVVIGEIAARLSGGYMSGWTYPCASGIQPTRGAIRIASGATHGTGAPTLRRVVAERAIMSIPGLLNGDIGTGDILRLPGVRECFISRSSGDEVSVPTNNVEKCGNLIIEADNRDVLHERIGSVLRQIVIPLQRAHPKTWTFLLGPDLPDRTAFFADPRFHGPLHPPVSRAAEHGFVRELSRTLVRSVLDQHAQAQTSTGDALDGMRSRLRNSRYHETLRDDEQDLHAYTRGDAISVVHEDAGTGTIALPMDLTVCILTLACERGGLQGLRYVIDTLSEEESCHALTGFLRQCYASH